MQQQYSWKSLLCQGYMTHCIAGFRFSVPLLLKVQNCFIKKKKYVGIFVTTSWQQDQTFWSFCCHLVVVLILTPELWQFKCGYTRTVRESLLTTETQNSASGNKIQHFINNWKSFFSVFVLSSVMVHKYLLSYFVTFLVISNWFHA